MFETRQKKNRSILKISSIIFFIIFTFYIIPGLYFLFESFQEEKKTKRAFNQSHPDLITVFTGDTGRIPFALEKAKEFEYPPLFITGVSSKLASKTILKTIKRPKYKKKVSIKIDYWAKNTLENVISTLSFARKHKNFKKILVISHDYHILRIKHIIERIAPNKGPHQFFYYGITKNYFNFRNLKILFKEIYKMAKTYAFLTLWEKELNQPIPIN
jgi:uncharacterized SAM-binding protein YcdF (DUF218 family)